MCSSKVFNAHSLKNYRPVSLLLPVDGSQIPAVKSITFIYRCQWNLDGFCPIKMGECVFLAPLLGRRRGAFNLTNDPWGATRQARGAAITPGRRKALCIKALVGMRSWPHLEALHAQVMGALPGDRLTWRAGSAGLVRRRQCGRKVRLDLQTSQRGKCGSRNGLTSIRQIRDAGPVLALDRGKAADRGIFAGRMARKHPGWPGRVERRACRHSLSF